MLNLTPQHIVKYLSVALIVAVILYVLPGEQVEMNYIIMVSLGAALFSFILDLLSKWYVKNKMSEGMEAVEYNYRNPIDISGQFMKATEEQDYANTGLDYDHDLPGYYLINNGKFSEGTIPYSESDELIEASKLHDLMQQHNYNIVTSPHTHIGKSRGHLNWEPVYD